MMHGIESRNDWSSWCTCGQGYSGEEHYERLLEHIKNPDPNSLAALIQRISLEEE